MKRKLITLHSFYSVIVYLARQAMWRNEDFTITLKHSRQQDSKLYEWEIALQASGDEKPERYITTTLDPKLWMLMGVVAGVERGEGGRL